MTWLQIVVLSVVQGITEFLPISSSAHLILVPKVTDWEDQGIGFDLAVHLGTLLAVVVYFRHDLRAMTRDWFCSLKLRRNVGESRLAWAVLWGTIPVGLAALLFDDFIEVTLRSPAVIAATSIGFGLLLWLADRQKGTRDEHHLTWRDVVVVGCAQALALIPGTSRSGVTITAALLLGMSRQGAARFSFLLSIPVTFLAGTSKMVEMLAGPEIINWAPFFWGGILSAITAFLCIHFFLKFLNAYGLMPYVWYRLALGALLIGVFVI